MVTESVDENTTEIHLKFGKTLSNPPPEDAVVISGISGSFPKSENIDELMDNLYNKKEMLELISGKYYYDTPELPKRSGFLPRKKDYDPGHFGTHWRLANFSDPCSRVTYECAFEALLDAGINPADMENSNTGIFFGTCMNESDKWIHTKPEQQFSFYGLVKSSIPLRLAYYLKLKGPALLFDTACSSSLQALEAAFREIRSGTCDAAIVLGANMCLRVGTTIQFQRLGVLSPEGHCKTFDEKADGYVRSEAISAVILQKAKDAKRVYAQIVNAKANSDGYKERGITFPSAVDQRRLLQDIYEESSVPPESLTYMEVHGTGTAVGDPEECGSVDKYICKNRKTPLLVGSVKSNLGHSEPASGLCSIAKVLVGMERGIMAPNMYYDKPNPNIKGLIEGRLEVVSEPTALNDEKPLIGVSSFGFGGSNAHILLKSVTQQGKSVVKDDLPRLLFVSGRTEEAVTTLLDDVAKNSLNVDHIALLQSSFSKYIPTHPYRGYNILSKSGEVRRAAHLVRSLRVPPLYLIFGEISSWETTLNEFASVTCFQDILCRVDKSLAAKKLSLNNTILNPKQEVRKEFDILGSLIVEIGIADTVKALNLDVTLALGYSYGELVCAYYDNILTLDEVVECALILNSELIKPSEQTNGHAGHSKPISKNSSTKDSLAQKLLSVLNTPRSWTNGSMKNKTASAEHFAEAVILKNKKEQPIQNDSIVFEIGSNQLQDAKNNSEEVQIFRFTDFQGFLEILGSLYFYGHKALVDKLYPKVEFPVKRGTPMISSKIKWKRTREWWVFSESYFKPNDIHKTYAINPTNRTWEYITGHIIDGRNLFPAAGYLYLAWNTLEDSMTRTNYSIIFEDCRFLRATTISNAEIKLEIQLNKSGYFEIKEGSSIVVTGIAYLKENESLIADMVPNSKRIASDDTMTQKDIYKELRLRGYNYKGDFRKIQEADINGRSAVIKYNNNWVTYLDNMFQLKILAKDTRSLYVPTSIDCIKIDCLAHKKLTACNVEDVNLDAFFYEEVDVIRSGAVEIKGLKANAISRRKNYGLPVLESYEFIPNNTQLSYEISLRVNTQILLENTLLQKIKCVELVDAETPKEPQILTEMVVESFGDQPLIQPNAKILSKLQLVTSVAVENNDLIDEVDCTLIIGSKLLQRPQTLLDASKALKECGYIISRESLEFNPNNVTLNNLMVQTIHRTSKEILVLLGKIQDKKEPIYIEVTDDTEFTWLSKVQEAMTKSKEVIVYSQNNPISGVLGFTNCLKREPGCEHVRCVLITDKNTNFDPSTELFADQLKKNLTVNVYKDGQWGTFRHLLLNQYKEVLNEHYFAKPLIRGDLSSFRWMEGNICPKKNADIEKRLVNIYYSALNFKDVMTATGKISVDVAHSPFRIEQDIVEGFEFSGIDENGVRVMGFQPGALANIVHADVNGLYKVPDEWSLKEAASVLCVYSTVIYALIERGGMKKGDSVLIHSGTGGVGQAAIHFCLHYGCNVFTTCGSASKKEFLLKSFPQLKASHVGNSRDISFKKMILRETQGEGVDLILNSLSEEKLLTSVMCLARGGRFLEIGKYDLSNNTNLNLLLLEKEASFHGILVDLIMKSCVVIKRSLQKLVMECLKDGAIKPLDVTVFSTTEVESAFRYMTSGKHMGKVLVEIQPENQLHKHQLKSLPRFYCDPEKCYVIVGGLGGFGLEIADWFILRGAMNLVLVSRSGVKNGYQKSRIQLWRNTYGVKITISTADTTTRKGCEQLIREAHELAPVGGIFNLAVVLRDGIFENQTTEMYKSSLEPKAYTTKYLDEITRKSCPLLDYFVIFSSVSCGRGNAGQTNYGLANSIMERICEMRKKDGLPATAIQWGAIGDVGLLADNLDDHKELEIGGTLQQKLSNCIEVMDILLRQNTSAVVSSIVVAEKRNMAGADSMSAAIANILGLDLKTVQISQTLAELGMDSMTSIEIKQVFEREYSVFLSPNEIRTLTFGRIKEFENEMFSSEQCEETEITQEKDILFTKAIRLMMEEVINEKLSVQLESNVSNEQEAPTIILIPGIEGFTSVLRTLAKKLNAHVIGANYDFHKLENSIPEMAKSEISLIEKQFNKNQPVCIAAHSYGSCIALEVVNYLEKKGYQCTLICLDGTPALLRSIYFIYPDVDSEIESRILQRSLDFCLSREEYIKYKENLLKLVTFEEKLNLSAEILSKHIQHTPSDCIYRLLKGLIVRFKSVKSHDPRYSLKSKIVLCKASQKVSSLMPHDLLLEKTCGRPVEIVEIEGDHVSFLDNDKLAEIINSCINN